jgi:dephospho-CoA kinase
MPSAKVFDADRAARELTDHDPEVQAELRRQFGPEVFCGSGDLNRAALRAIVFSDPAKKLGLERILHPRIRLQWSVRADDARESGVFFLADIPLLYETGGEKLCDSTVVVACSGETQRQRLIARGFSQSDAEKMIESQMPLTEKIARAEHVVWNNGTKSILGAQAELLSALWLQ